MKKKTLTLKLLTNVPKQHGYKYNEHFCTDKGCYTIYSRGGKKFYLHGDKSSTLMMLPDTPFKNPTDAKNYLRRRINRKSNYESANKRRKLRDMS